MLKHGNFEEIPSKEELKERLKAAQAKLAKYQLEIKDKKIPVYVLMEGWGAAGKGKLIGKIIKNIDPRHFKVATMAAPSADDLRRPFFYRFMKEIPEAGKFTFLDTGWMEETSKERLLEGMSEEDYATRISGVKHFERQLTDNGYLVLKFFLHINQEEQEKRMEHFLANEDAYWRINDFDKWQNKNYDECVEVFSTYMNDTNLSQAPWYVVDSTNYKWAEVQLLELMNSAIEVALQNNAKSVPILQNTFPLVKMPKLDEIDLESAVIDDVTYKKELKRLQKKLSVLHDRLYRKRIPVIIAYEGWDAAGKGGNIKRITGALDPRGYEVHPIASPEPHEKARHHLWRFWTRLPKTGHVAIFDRTWYGRLMVERLEGFCTENDWKRCFNEINEFEKDLVDWGAVIFKFWVEIDKDTQLERFTERQNNPEKQWKITEEDWRNREKWDAYEGAVNEMLQKTSTRFAPWYILESVDKKYARIKALKIIVEELERRLND